MIETATNDEAAQIVPGFCPETDPPNILVKARRHLEVATNEFYLALQRFELWRVLAYEKSIPERLGRSYAGGGYMQVRSAIFEALLVTLTRMFDKGARGKEPLSLKNISQSLCKPEVQTYIARIRLAEALDFPRPVALVTELGDADRAQFEQDAEAKPCKAAERTKGEFAALVRLQRALKKRSRFDQAQERLHRLRDTEIAHRDLQPAATTVARPMYRDLDTLFGAAAVLIRRMNKLAFNNRDINYPTFSQTARLRALAFAAGLRAESPAEQRELAREIRPCRSARIPPT